MKKIFYLTLKIQLNLKANKFFYQLKIYLFYTYHIKISHTLRHICVKKCKLKGR
jgi:hypothetical protein